MGIIFIVFLLVLVYLLISQSRSGQSCLFGGGHTTTGPAETPLEALQKRYARGEIGRDEYQERRRELS